MARVTITAQALPAATGFNLTDATFTTMATGTGNGVSFAYDARDVVVLKNTTGGNAIYTFVVGKEPSNYAAYSIAVTDPTVTVATLKTHLIKLNSIFEQTGSLVFIDCDVAADILVLNL